MKKNVYLADTIAYRHIEEVFLSRFYCYVLQLFLELSMKCGVDMQEKYAVIVDNKIFKNLMNQQTHISIKGKIKIYQNRGQHECYPQLKNKHVGGKI